MLASVCMEYWFLVPLLLYIRTTDITKTGGFGALTVLTSRLTWGVVFEPRRSWHFWNLVAWGGGT